MNFQLFGAIDALTADAVGLDVWLELGVLLLSEAVD